MTLLHPPPPPEFIAFAHELASAAGSIILQFWRLPNTVDEKFEVDRACASSPVTAADRNAEKAMRTLIASRYPSHGVLGEEYGPSPCSELGELMPADLSEWTWVLDPIDGTKSFITGKPLFGTLIALCHHGEPVLGVIDQCVLAERWVGTAAETTFNAKRVRASTACSELADALCYATTPHMFKPGYEAAAIHRLRSRIKRMLYGCDCYAYALLASDFGVDLVCEADLQPYDYLALVPVLRGAGATITDWTGRPLTLQSTTTAQGRVLAAASDQLHAKALAILRRPPLLFYLSSYPNLSLAFAFAAGAACSALLLRR